jgi:pimeloyl-ACP methyl ester carboxylesterase
VLRSHLQEGSRVIALDLPGNGALWRERSPASIAGMVEAYRHQLAALGVNGRITLLGLSMGSMVAAEWAARYPDELRGSLLVNGSARGLTPPWRRLNLPAWMPLLASLLPGRSAYAREAALLRLCSEAPVENTAPQWASYAIDCPTSALNAIRQLWAAARWRLPQQRPRVPLLVVTSTRDRLVSSEASAAIAHCWNMPLVAHPAAGHELGLDAPEWLARQCASFALSRSLRTAR